MNDKLPMTFKDLKLIAPLQVALEKSGYTNPTPIQEKAIPPLLEGRDILGCAQTGTGKTAAFALPILHRLTESTYRAPPRHTRVLVLTPTRELAIQVHESFATYGKNLNLRYVAIYGGVGQEPQVRSLAKGVDVLVATPGRLLDLINQAVLKLSGLEVFILDEADRMLDMGFINDIKKILKFLPSKRHNLFFSATMPPVIETLANSILNNPVRIEVAPVSSTAELIDQYVMLVDRENKRPLLKHILENNELKKVIVFTRTKHGANKIVDFLGKNNVLSSAIHGNKSQGARQLALENFRSGKIRVLVATDIAARGIDIDGITHVVNYDLPNETESYVHRIGRTARAGNKGIAISFCDIDERTYLRDIEKLIAKKITLNSNQPFHSVQVEDAIKNLGTSSSQAPKKDNNRPKANNGQFGRAGKPRYKTEKKQLKMGYTD